jgi:hypothetical protein
MYKIFNIYNGIDIKRINLDELSHIGDNIIIGSVGRQTTQKNQILKAIRSGYSDMIRQWEKKPKIATADVKKTFWDDINNNI